METIEEYILLKYLEGLASEEEKAQVETWLQESSENQLLLEQLYFTIQVSNRLKVMKSVDPEQALSNFKEKVNKQKEEVNKQIKKVSWLRKWKMLQQIAAILIFLVLVLSAFLLLQNNPEIEVCAVTVRTNPGVVSTFELPDGSHVWLNAGSTLTYPTDFNSKFRAIELSGEGYFEINQNPLKPFIINLNPDYSIEVLGTSFNVSAYDEDDFIETTLVEGSIKLNVLTDEGKKVTKEIKPNEKAEYKKDSHTIEISTVNTDLDTSWINGEIRFRRLPMEKVLKVLSRHFNVDFIVKNKEIYDSVINLTVKDETIHQVMEYLKISSGITYQINKNSANNESSIGKTTIEISK